MAASAVELASVVGHEEAIGSFLNRCTNHGYHVLSLGILEENFFLCLSPPLLSRENFTPDPPSSYHLPFDRLMALSKSKGCVAFPSSAVACYGGRALASPSLLRVGISLAQLAAYCLYASVGPPRRPRSKSGICDLHLTACWCPGLSLNPKLSLPMNRFDGGFWCIINGG
jgi:hypothetical protein